MRIVGPAKVDVTGNHEQHFQVTDFALPKQPKLTGLSPSSAAIGDPPLTLTLDGSDFQPESVIVFNGGEEATTFVDNTKLTTGVQPATASVPGDYPVLVRTFSHETAPQTFSFTEAGTRSGRAKR